MTTNTDPLVDQLAYALCHDDRPCPDCVSGAGRALKFLANAGRLLPDGGESRTEWAAEIAMLDGGLRHSVAADQQHAGLIAEGINAHVASLNEPTRRENGIDSARIVRREVRSWPDRSSYTTPWVEVTDAT